MSWYISFYCATRNKKTKMLYPLGPYDNRRDPDNSICNTHDGVCLVYRRRHYYRFMCRSYAADAGGRNILCGIRIFDKQWIRPDHQEDTQLKVFENFENFLKKLLTSDIRM